MTQQTTLDDTTTLVVAGSRTIQDDELVEQCIGKAITTIPGQDKPRIISGGADGVDSSAETFARRFRHPFEVYEADWKTHGKAAGPKRNTVMARTGDVLCAVWDGESSGTEDMIQKALTFGLDTHVFIHDG